MATTSLDEETTKKVIRQVEFYFSDSNLPRDNFLSNTIAESGDGMVSLALICSFSRMRSHLGLGDKKKEEISEDTVKAVAETLRTSTFLKVSEDGKQIGRSTELPKPEEVIEQLDVRTIAASPLEYDIKLEDVESFFGQFAKVNSVRLPRHVADKKLFCGTALVEFSAEEDATRILTQSLVYGGAELELRPKKDFDANRAKEEAAQNSRPQRKNSSSPEENYPRGLIVAFTLKNKSIGDSATSNGSVAHADDNVEALKTNAKPDSMEGVTVEGDAKRSENAEGTPGESIVEADGKVDEKTNLESEEVKDGKEPLESPPIQKDEDKSSEAQKSAVETFKDNMDVVLREDLKSVFQKFGTVKFVDFRVGAESGYIRFEEEEGSQKARAAAVLAEEGGLIVKNFVATLDPVTGEAEKEYWKQFCGNRDNKFRGGRGGWNRGGKHGGGRGGRHSNGKHSRSRDNDSSHRPNKSQKVGAA